MFVQFRQQNDTLLFVWIGPRDDGDATFRVAHIVGQVRHIGGDVKKVTSSSDEMVLESIAVPNPGFADEDINGGFVICVHMRLGSPTGWNSCDL